MSNALCQQCGAVFTKGWGAFCGRGCARSTWTPEHDRTLIEMRMAGHGMPDIERVLGRVGAFSRYKRLAKAGLAPPLVRIPLNPEECSKRSIRMWAKPGHREKQVAAIRASKVRPPAEPPFEAPAGSIWIPLTKGFSTLVDEVDFTDLQQFSICATLTKSGTAYATMGIGARNVFLHRYLMGDPEDSQVDHKNRNTLDNRRSNLRHATSSNNNCNRRLGETLSGVRGVYIHKNRFIATIGLDRKVHRLGSFSSMQDAIAARDAAAKTLHGEFAVLNNPTENAP